jgi:hypothetical protein
VPTPEDLGRLRPGVRYHWIVERLDETGGTPAAPGVFWLDGR